MLLASTTAASTATAATTIRDVIAIDMGVPDWASLIAHLDPAIGVILLPAGGDGVAALALGLAEYGALDALHIVSHGAAGQLQLGSVHLDAAALGGENVALAAIASHLAPGADVLLYGCSVAEGAAGEAYVAALSAALGGADVAASVNPTGAAALGGDWMLEYTRGYIDTALPFAPEDVVVYQALLGSDDATTPTATITHSAVLNTNASTSTYTVTFSQGVSGVDASDFALTKGGTLAGSVTSVTNVDKVYTVTVGGITGDGVLGFKLVAATSHIVSDNSSAIPLGIDVTGPDVTFDHTKPTVLSVAAPTAKWYGFGETIAFVVTVSEPIANVIGTSYLALVLDSGGTARANYVSYSGNTVTFRYTVGASALDTNGVTLPARITSSGGLVDAAGNTLDLTLNNVASMSGVLVDGVAPTVSSVAAPANASYGVGQVLDFTVNYSEAVTVVTTGGMPTIALTLNTGGTVQASYASGSGTSALHFRYTVASGNVDADGVALASAVVLNGGTLQDVASNNAALTLASVGALTGVLVDGVAPAVTAIARAGAATSSAASIAYTVTFGEGVSGVDIADFALRATGATTGHIASVSGSGSSYTVTVDGVSGAGTLALDLKASGTGIVDGASNAIAGGFTAGDAVTIVAVPSAPTLATNSDSGSSHSDGITNITTPTFTGTALAPGGAITLYDTDGSTVLGTATASGGSGAWSITSSALSAGQHSITVKEVDGSDPASLASAAALVVIDTSAPAPPSAPVFDRTGDHGASASDGVTNLATPTFTGTAEDGATVTLYDSDGSTVVGSTTAAVGGAWSITTSALGAGTHTLKATATDVAGNASAAVDGSTLTIDTSAPTLAITSSVAALKSGQTATITFSFSEDPGTTFTWDGSNGDVVVTGGTLGAIAGSGLTRTATFTPSAATNNGSASITVNASAYDDLAGNHGSAGSTPALTFDTLAPSAPPAPVLALASDTGTAGDNITTVTTPVITGTAEANAHLTLFDTNGSTVLGSATANGSGAWSITSAALAVGVHNVSVTQADAAGNLSPAGAALALTIAAPVEVAPPAPPPPLVDGVAVVSAPVIVAAGDLGTRVVVPVVPVDRVDTGGGTGVADIPLATASAGTVLLAQVAPGVGLTATGAASAPAGDSLAKLIATINAAAPANSADQQYLAAGSQGFIALLPATVPLLIETVAPISAAAAPSGALTLTGTSSATQHTALVIDASGLAPGSQLQLNAVDFAAIVGAVTVTGSTTGQILSGDAARQQFNVAANLGSTVFAGGGDDTLQLTAAVTRAPLGAAAAPVPAGSTILHGGTGADTAVFSGLRAAYTLDLHDGYIVLSPLGAPQQKTLLVNVESLQFSDATVAVDNHAGLTSLAGLYQTVLGRQPDVAGFDYWGKAELQGASLGQIALAMMGANESLAARQGFTGNADHDLALLYQGVLGRAIDSAGLAYWSAVMARGATLEQVTTSLVGSPEFASHALAATAWNFSL